MMIKPPRTSRNTLDDEFLRTVGALADFRYALRRFLSFSESMVRAMGVTSQQHQALLLLAGAGDEGVMIRDLAEAMLMLPHGAVQLVNRLEEAGFAERRADASDGRVSRVHATPRAIDLMRVLVKAHARELRQHEQLLVRSLAAVRRLEKVE
jgi:DNA-binding MarR family transcriptional regulator